MYQTLRAEIARKNISLTKIAEETGIALQNLSKKINCRDKRGFLLTEAASIKKAIGSDMTLEDLFERTEA